MGVEEGDTSVVAALAGGGHLGGHASAASGGRRGTRDDAVGVWRRGCAFPPGEGGGVGVARSGKGKGRLIHSLTEGYGMPLANRITPANGDARA
jgi:hypothetical protein